MWRQFLADERCRFASATLPTVLVFPSPLRIGWTLDRRVAELDEWCERLRCPQGYAMFIKDLLALKVREAAESDCTCLCLQRDVKHLTNLRATLDQQRRCLDELRRELDEMHAASARDRELIEQQRLELGEAGRHLALQNRRPEATALAIVSGLRRIRRAVLPPNGRWLNRRGAPSRR
jgi:hypothetical protein